MKQVVWTETYDVNTIVVDRHKRLGLVGLLNLLQDAAWLHARHLGWGYEELIKQRTIWVLARQKLVMQAWPQWGDAAVIRTWPRGTAGALATHDFEILVDDRRLGECTTSWLILDMDSRKPKKLDRAAFEEMRRKEGYLAIDAGKIALRSDLAPVETYRVHYSDLDVNGHVNNTRYAQWIVDSLTAEEQARDIAEYEINFLAEARVGDAVTIERDGGQFQGRRQDEDKPVFAARLSLSG